MNDFETEQAQTASLSEADDLRRRCGELEWQATYLRAALVVLSCSLCAFVGIQWKQARSELTNVKPAAIQIIQGFQRERPMIETLIVRLGEYGRTHADFRPILGKYSIPIPPAPAATSSTPPAATPKPAPAAKK